MPPGAGTRAEPGEGPLCTKRPHNTPVIPQTPDEVRRFLEVRLREPLPGPAAQRRFAASPRLENWAPELTPDEARRAAALILVYPRANVLTVPLTVRHPDLPHHGGQVSLPGGALDPGESAEAAALREVEEEIGVHRRHVQILGALSTLWVAVSNFVVTPFVGIAEAEPVFAPHPGEVSAILRVSLDALCHPQAAKWDTRDRRGTTVRFPYFDVGGHKVWGATAMMLGEFACLFSDNAPPPPAN